MRAISSRSAKRASTRTTYSAAPSAMLPPVTSTFSRCSRLAICDSGIPSRAARLWSTLTWISSSTPPATIAAATPSRLSRRCLIDCSASSRRPAWSATVTSPGTALPTLMRMIGSRAGSKRSRIGSSAAAGSASWASCSRTSMAAKSMSVPQANSMITSERPARDTLEMSTRPETMPTASSIGVVTKVSTSVGATPGYSVRMVRVGNDRSGSRSTGSSRNETTPKITRATKNTTTVTGRRVAAETIFTAADPGSRLAIRWLRDAVRAASRHRIPHVRVGPP